jgi:ABC-type transport system involved in multi-copper enzyme maturation permease subunit
MMRSIGAELLILRKRAATWVLLGLWTVMVVFFGYILPYVTYRNDSGRPGSSDLADMLPERLVATVLGGFPFFGGVLILILGVLTIGSEYGWGTLKTLFTQRPGRLQIFGAKLAALGIALIGFVLASFAAGALSSVAIAVAEDAAINWPDPWLLVRGLAGAWLIFAVWSALGVALAVFTRGTALAIGIGILYGLVIEGLIARVFDQVDLMQPLVKILLRANAYSLIEPLGASVDDAASNGPGAFEGPYVGGVQSLLVMGIYLALFVAISAWVLRRRDVA